MKPGQLRKAFAAFAVATLMSVSLALALTKGRSRFGKRTPAVTITRSDQMPRATTEVNEIDSYRDNYWCAEPPTSMTGGAWQGEGEDKPKAAPIAPPEFLQPSQALALRQAAALQALGTAPNYLCRVAIEWAEKNPTDVRAPEALHLAVRSEERRVGKE